MSGLHTRQLMPACGPILREESREERMKLDEKHNETAAVA
jgi:hypothetical protein